MSIILAIESSTEIASAALHIAQANPHQPYRVLSQQVSGVQSHSQTVLPMVQALLDEAGLVLADCNAIAFGAGPGSFTGVRTACGIAQGLAYGSDLPVIAVDTLVAAAQACRDATGAGDVLVVIDARMAEVYWGQYRWLSEGHWEVVTAARVGPPAEVRAIGPVHGCGNGFAVYAGAFADVLQAGARAGCMPHAVQVAALAQALLTDGKAVPARDARPIYLRNEVALTTAERAVRAAAAA